MKNRTLATACFEFTAKEVDELLELVEYGIESLDHALGFYSHTDTDTLDEIEQRVIVLETISVKLEKAIFPVKEVSNDENV